MLADVSVASLEQYGKWNSTPASDFVPFVPSLQDSSSMAITIAAAKLSSPPVLALFSPLPVDQQSEHQMQ
jgi:hypothetical protein